MAVLLTGNTLRAGGGVARRKYSQVPQGRNRLAGHGEQEHTRSTAYGGQESTTVEAHAPPLGRLTARSHRRSERDSLVASV